MLRKILSLTILIVWLTGCMPGEINPQAGSNNQKSAAGEVAQAALPVVQGNSTAPTDSITASSVSEVQIAQESRAVDPPLVVEPDAKVDQLAVVAQTIPEQPAAVDAPLVAADPATNQAGAIHPLTGQEVKDPASLTLAPALVSITNFPVSARPQAGLSYSPFVFEMYVGEGMTRFLALFHGDYPVKGEDTAIALADDRVGPIRSGRLPYESLRLLYNGFLVMASASSNVTPSLGMVTNVFGSDSGDINSAFIPATRLQEIAAKNPKRLAPDALDALSFSESAPDGGKPANAAWIPYSYLNQVLWRFNAPGGGYFRYQDNADGETFIQASDRLNNEPLEYQNVVILFANHRARAETLIDIDLMYVKRMPALLFRDGKMYEIFWTTANGEYERKTGLARPIRFIDAEGKPFPLKPGQTWIEIVQPYTRYNETVDSQNYFDLKRKTSPGSGVWAIQFYPPAPEK